MTSYSISPGYQSGASGNVDADEAWSLLKTIAIDVANNGNALVEEVHREGLLRLTVEDADEYKRLYRERDDLTLKIWEPEDANDRGKIRQCASGGGVHRCIKEAFRRAFIRLVMFEMHRRGAEVNVNVS